MSFTGIKLARTQVFAIGFLAFFVGVLLFLRIVLVPILIAFLLAFVFEPFISRCEMRGFKRWIMALTIVVLGCLLVLVAAWVAVPILFNQLQSLFSQFPQLVKNAQDQWIPAILRFGQHFFHTVTQQDAENQIRRVLSSSFFPEPQLLLSGITKGTQTLAIVFFDVILTPVLTFVVIKNVPTLAAKVKDSTPIDMREKYAPVLTQFNKTLRDVLLGQILTVSLLSILYSTAFTAAGMPLGFAVGFITGFVRLIPYMDVLVGGSLAVFVMLTHAPLPTGVIVASAASFAAIQILDMFLLTPRILGKFSGIHPLLIVLAVLCFGDWFGFLGVLLAIPMAAIAKVALTHILSEYRQSEFFRNGKNVKTME